MARAELIAPWLQPAWQHCVAQLEQGRMPHALLLAGPAGLGKRAFAQALAARLLCERPDASGQACGECRGCHLRIAGSHPDHQLLSFEPNREGKLRTELTVDQVRTTCQRLSMTPQFGGWQVVLIDPADALNAHAANALLKTLEEPAANTTMVLVSDSPSRLPATVRSRCQRVDARFPAAEQALHWLAHAGVQEAPARTALAFAAGNPGEALDYASGARAACTQEVVQGVADLLSGRQCASQLAARWSDTQAGVRLSVLTQCLRLLARAQHGDEALPSALAAAARLLRRAEFPKLWFAWERTNRARREIPGPLRTELVIAEVLDAVASLGAGVAQGRG